MLSFLKSLFGSSQDRKIRRYFKIVAEINTEEKKLQALSDEELKQKTAQLKERFQAGETVDSLLVEAYAVVKNGCRRLLGKEVHVSGYDQKWDMVPHDVQILGAIAMHHNTVVEMMTGEGKTLTALMPLYLNALTGKPVHLVTVNDYLCKRDCEWVGEVLRYLGLTTAALTNEIPPYERKQLYLSDVVYGTASEFGFDYLRDNSMANSKEDQVQRGYYFAIIDEADSILIDEARTPLIISGPVPVSRQMYGELSVGVHEIVKKQRDICNQLAGNAKKTLDSLPKDRKLTKEQKDLEEEAYKTLWIVSKGTPKNRILKKSKEDPDVRARVDAWDVYFHSDINKEEKQEAIAGLLLVIDEKSNEFELTDKGIQAWQEFGNADDFVMMDVVDRYLWIDQNHQLSMEEKAKEKELLHEEDEQRKERSHNLRQLFKAHLLMDKDVDYIVQSDKVLIIDENTGRIQQGRRFSDGLHQAIEAKENVTIEKETQTYATITLQNFFRMYDKLAGMTGTATTEASEFKQIYKLDVIEVPTNKPCLRADSNDEIYMTEREKFSAILKEIERAHSKGQPLLIGTESVDVSEKLSRILRLNKLPHTVLNAKNHEKEAEIIADAGKEGAITIATNMAGRGTDIKLGQGIANIGGLYVIGTTRHPSRRIDRQLRGRSARQGDPGASKFYVSFEDSLLRLFASPRMNTVLQRFRPPEGEPISASILNKSIETAQKRVEQRNYMMRKHTLEYDDVMNLQRQEIYAYRNDLLHIEKAVEIAKEMLEEAVSFLVEDHLGQSKRDFQGLRIEFSEYFPIGISEEEMEEVLPSLSLDKITEYLSQKVLGDFAAKLNYEHKKMEMILQRPLEDAFDFIDHAVRSMMIRKLDQLWQEHLLKMDYLRTDVNLRAVGQRDPLMEFKHEAFALFASLSKALRLETARQLFRFEMAVRRTPTSSLETAPPVTLESKRSFFPEEQKPLDLSSEEEEVSQEQETSQKIVPFESDPKESRNDLCGCGSQKKYKKCCALKK